MPQAQRVTHLVHDGFLDVVLHKLARDGAVGVKFSARFQHVKRIAQLFGRQRAMHAAGEFGRHRAIYGRCERLGK